MEVVQGWHKRQREDRVQAFLATLATEEVLMLELRDAELAGRIYADLERTGQPIGYPDSIIAAQTAEHLFSSPRHGHILVTDSALA